MGEIKLRQIKQWGAKLTRSGLTLILTSLAFCLTAANPAWAGEPPELLKPEQAFQSELERVGNHMVLTLKVAEGYYLYRDRIHISTEPAKQLQKPVMPPGVLKLDPYFGKQMIYQQVNRILLPLKTATPGRFTVVLRAQGCAKAGICYPPFTRRLEVGAQDGLAEASWQARPAPAKTEPTAAGTSIVLTLLTFFVAGLGMAFTACMYPLLPILTSLIAGQGSQLNRRRGFLLSFSYVQGLALTYTLIGVVAGLTGALLTVWLQRPAVMLSASVIMLLFALSMFDLFSIQLPASLQSRLASTSNRLTGGRVLTVAAMGVLSALIIGPCVAPPLALALGYIGARGDVGLGAASLYCMALGLGLPLMLIGTFGGHFLPRAGRWMNVIKAIFGVIMLAVALQIASPFLPGWLTMLGWSVLTIGSAVFLGTFDRPSGKVPAMSRIARVLGILLLLIGVAELAGMLAGQQNPRYPLAWLNGQAQAQAQSPKPAFVTLSDLAELDQRLAQNHGQVVLLDFYADWCSSCQELERTTWPSPLLTQRLQKMTLLRVDVTHNTAGQAALLARFGLYGPPGIILLDAKGQERGRIIGYIAPAELAARLDALTG